MFDPSKIDLDLENLDNNDSNGKNNKKSEEKTDILNDFKKINKKIEEDSKELIENKNDEIIISKEENSNIVEEKIEENNREDMKSLIEDKIIFDINIVSIEYLIKYLQSKEYDFFTLEPDEEKVKVSFRKDNIEKEVKYIKYHIYSKILLKAKSITKLNIEDSEKSQEWSTEINLLKKVYKLLSKTVPSNHWEKLFFKLVETEKKQTKKKKEKMTLWKMMSIFAWLLFTSIVIWGVFIAIVLFNSTSVSDLTFFNNLWVNTNLIKEFAAKLVDWIFGFILLIEIIFLFVFSYKALLTKKEFKQKKINRIIISIFFLILSVITLITWMFLAQKINSLKWLNYWKIEFYDNSQYLSELFEKESSKIDINDRIIWPITLRFNNEEFIKKLVDDWFTPQKVIWSIWKVKKEVAIEDYEVIHTFSEKWLTQVNIEVEWINIKWENEVKVKDVWKINIANIVKIQELKLDNWWSKFLFDAYDLEQLWKVEWYYIPSIKGKTDNEANNIISESLTKPKLEWYKFTSKNIFEWEEYYWIKIKKAKEEETNDSLDKIFIISKWEINNIKWKIQFEADLNNKNKYTFKFSNPETNLWEAYIQEYIWNITDYNNEWVEQKITLKSDANLVNLEKSSKVEYIFKKDWKHKIELTILDSEWKEQNFVEEIIIQKNLTLLTKLIFKINNTELEYKKDIIYEKNNNTYYLEDIPAPSNIEIDANKIRALNNRYWLQEVSMDLDNDWNFEIVSKKEKFNVIKEWIASFKIKYTFINKNIKTDIVNVIETIHVTSINKESVLDLQIIKPSSYVPVIVKFDASWSRVNWKDIQKFIFDYWDWTSPEERDSTNNWHKYIKSWDYDIKLTVITSTWESYFMTKKLILKNKPQDAKITNSLKKAPLYQAIDFSAEDSIWEVSNYLWDFWDWDTSTKISPSHFYTKAWTYKVKLDLEYTNKNTLSDEVEIIVYEE